MKPKTVKELKKELEEAIESGYGDYLVLVSDDEECNGYHPLYFGVQAPCGVMEYVDGKTSKNKVGRCIPIE